MDSKPPKNLHSQLIQVSLAGALVLGACAGILPDHYTFKQEQLQRALDKKFPYERKVMEIFTVQLTQPQLTLMAESNRLRVTTNVSLRAPIGPVYHGTLTVQSGVRFDAKQSALVLTQPVVEQFDVQNFPQASSLISTLGRGVVEPLLQDYPIKTFRPEELQFAGVTLVPSSIWVTSEGVRINLVK